MSEPDAHGPQPGEPVPHASALDFPVAGIGASAGGLVALRELLSAAPAQPGMAFVVILHLSPTHESNAAEILQRCTSMPVVQVTHSTPIACDHVYIVPPNRDLAMDDGHLRLREAERPRTGVHASIDLFFRTLAQAHGDKGIGVVLSGTGRDGALGLARIKEAGGITVAQRPDDAEHDGMPRAAIATGMVDLVLPAGEIAPRLQTLSRNMRQIRMPAEVTLKLGTDAMDPADSVRRAERSLAEIMTLLRQQTRHDFKHYKRATVLRRIERRLQVHGLPDLAAYAEFIRLNPSEAALLLQDLLISVTNFFRDSEAFEVLERDVVPALFARRRADDPVRVWVAGCATGEEAYSIAILLREHAERLGHTADIQLFATDIDERAIAIARTGLYSDAIAADVSSPRLRQFFVREGDSYRVAKAIREKVLFAAHNILRDPPFSRLDLVCCRNLLIYLDRRAQISVLDMFRFALKPEAVLFLGLSESPEAASEAFVALDKKHRIYRAGSGAAPARNLPVLSPHGQEQRFAVAPGHVGERRAPSNAEIHRRSLEQLLPPSALVDSQLNILHLSDGAGAFMQHASGPPSHNLLSNVSAELRLELRTALYAATQSHEPVEVRNIRMERGGKAQAVHLSVRPFRSEDGAELALVVFDASPDAAPPAPAHGQDAVARQVVEQLEHENRRLKEHLQDTIEHSETSTEELKASNEELQAINEELRSATEELETSKEELQSTNEELTTVNLELKLKVEETSLINDDLHNLIASTDIATVFVDRALLIKRFTPQAATLFSLIASDVGRSLLDITHKLAYPSLADDARQAFVSLRIIERAVDSVDGRRFLARFLPYRTAEDKIVGAVLNFVDITALHAAEEKLRLGEQRLRLAAEATRDFAIMTLDEQGIVTAWNAGAVRLFQWREEEIVGQSVEVLFTEDDRQLGVPRQEMQRALADGRAEDERWHKRKDGSVFYCSGVMSPLVQGEERGFAKIARDMTEHRQLVIAQELLLAQEQSVRQQAQAASNLKDEFLAVMSHELKHPLNLIHVNADLLTRLPAALAVPAVLRAGEAIRRAAGSQAKIIDDLLDLSRARTGKMTLRTAELVLNDVVEAIVLAAGVDAAAVGVALELNASAEPLKVRCDQVRIEQIVWNLIGNAIKFTPSGGSVSVTLERHEGQARLIVQDSGRGIDAAFLPHIFEMFSQEHVVRAPNERGLGIGLALVRELVQAQGGQVAAASDGPGQGSRFIVLLPLAGVAASDEAPRAMAQAAGNPLRGLRILLVDDSRDTLEIFGELLELEDAIVDTADGGRRALDMLAATPYDLLISDLGMPEMTGYEFIAAARQRPEGRLPALALSGFGREADIAKALRAGFDGHLSKPSSIDDLKIALGRLRLPAR